MSILGLPASGKLVAVAIGGILFLLWFNFGRIHYTPNPIAPVLRPLSRAERGQFMDCYYGMGKKSEDQLRDCLVTNQGWSEVNARKSLAKLAALRRK